jgi:hypothetical protein
LSKSQIQKLEKEEEVVKIYLLEIKPILFLQSSMDDAETTPVHTAGVKGSGVKVAVWEGSPDNWNNLSVTEAYDLSPEDVTDHARLTTAIIKNRQRSGPNGYAPDCVMHSANSYDLDALKWALEKECTVISQSWGYTYETDSIILRCLQRFSNSPTTVSDYIASSGEPGSRSLRCR